ncbi:MAG: 30S ribosomal protein S3 [Bacteroidetes bacterium]|nr:MAG: 30S ribosomal protein S3 [Bacteroidota bacterium]
MGQKTHPIGFRLGIIKGWDSNWFGGRDFSDKLIEDEQIRNYLNTRIQRGGISKIVIERTLRKITITIHTSRPGIVIGKGGKEVDSLREEIKRLTGKEVQINIYEIKRPELDAMLVAMQITQQLESRVSFRRAMKAALSATMRAGAGGCKIMCSGRLGGAEMARREMYKEGRIPLQTLRADIDYALAEALTIYGKIGVKVWIFKKEVYGKVDLSPNLKSDRKRPGGGGERGDRDRGERGGDRDRNNNSGGGGDRNKRRRK